MGAPACAPTQAELRHRLLSAHVNQLQDQMARLQRRVENLSQDVSLCQALSSPRPAHAGHLTPVSGDAKDPAEQFELALRQYEQGAPAQAYRAFAAWLKAHPDHSAADRARFWMGQCKYELGEFAAAVEHFGQLPEAYPSSQKAPDALLKMGLAYERLDEDEQATTTFARLVASYPHSASADLARSRLQAVEARHARR